LVYVADVGDCVGSVDGGGSYVDGCPVDAAYEHGFKQGALIVGTGTEDDGVDVVVVGFIVDIDYDIEGDALVGELFGQGDGVVLFVADDSCFGVGHFFGRGLLYDAFHGVRFGVEAEGGGAFIVAGDDVVAGGTVAGGVEGDVGHVGCYVGDVECACCFIPCVSGRGRGDGDVVEYEWFLGGAYGEFLGVGPVVDIDGELEFEVFAGWVEQYFIVVVVGQGYYFCVGGQEWYGFVDGGGVVVGSFYAEHGGGCDASGAGFGVGSGVGVDAPYFMGFVDSGAYRGEGGHYGDVVCFGYVFFRMQGCLGFGVYELYGFELEFFASVGGFFFLLVDDVETGDDAGDFNGLCRCCFAFGEDYCEVDGHQKGCRGGIGHGFAFELDEVVPRGNGCEFGFGEPVFGVVGKEEYFGVAYEAFAMYADGGCVGAFYVGFGKGLLEFGVFVVAVAEVFAEDSFFVVGVAFGAVAVGLHEAGEGTDFFFGVGGDFYGVAVGFGLD